MTDSPKSPKRTMEGDGTARLDDGKHLDVMAMSWCEDCETFANLDEIDIPRDTQWLEESCECGEVEFQLRVAPWPRDDVDEDRGGARGRSERIDPDDTRSDR